MCLWQVPTPVSCLSPLICFCFFLGNHVFLRHQSLIFPCEFVCSSCSKNSLKPHKIMISSLPLVFAPSRHSIHCSRHCSEKSGTHSFSKRSNREGQQENSQLAQKFWDSSFICIKLGKRTQVLYLVLFYPRISRFFVLLPTQFQFSKYSP